MDNLDQDLNWVGELGYFNGTTAYHSFGEWPGKLTDGAKFVADNAKCYWMFDVIESKLWEHRANHGECFDNRLVVSTIKVNPDRSAVITMENGNGNILFMVKIEFTDFPLPQFTVWAQWSSCRWIHMLSSEY